MVYDAVLPHPIDEDSDPVLATAYFTCFQYLYGRFCFIVNRSQCWVDASLSHPTRRYALAKLRAS
jgi:hypothetical protein